MPYDLSLCNSFGRDTESNAREKSIYATRFCDLFSIETVQSFSDSNRLVKVDVLNKKPCWLVFMSLFRSRYNVIDYQVIYHLCCYNSFHYLAKHTGYTCLMLCCCKVHLRTKRLMPDVRFFTHRYTVLLSRRAWQSCWWQVRIEASLNGNWVVKLLGSLQLCPTEGKKNNKGTLLIW